jgi:hypothetical protein
MTSSDEERLKQLEALAEKYYDEMYETRSPSGSYSDAKECLYEAINLARQIGREDEADRLEKRLDHIKAVFRSQMS